MTPTTYFPPITTPDPPYLPGWLGSFHLPYFFYFIGTLFPGYILYRVLAKRLCKSWECNSKNLAEYYGDFYDLVLYSLVLFIFGNYSVAFSWITIIAFYVGLVFYSIVSNLSFARHSIVTISNWGVGMWACISIGVLVGLGLGAFHFYLAFTTIYANDVAIGGWYAVAFVVLPLLLLGSGAAVHYMQNQYVSKCIRLLEENRRGAETAEENNTSPQGGKPRIAEAGARQNVVVINATLHKRVEFHLHHWQIFYFLAFFTRFDHIASQISAGLCLGIFMQGVAAYGFHDLLDEKAVSI